MLVVGILVPTNNAAERGVSLQILCDCMRPGISKISSLDSRLKTSLVLYKGSQTVSSKISSSSISCHESVDSITWMYGVANHRLYSNVTFAGDCADHQNDCLRCLIMYFITSSINIFSAHSAEELPLRQPQHLHSRMKALGLTSRNINRFTFANDCDIHQTCRYLRYVTRIRVLTFILQGNFPSDNRSISRMNGSCIQQHHSR